MKFLISVQLLIITCFVAFCLANQMLIEARVFLYGSFFGLVNTFLLYISIRKLLFKKSPFLALFFLLFKYGFFGIALYFIVKQSTISLPWLIFGLSVPVPSMILYGLFFIKGQKLLKEVR